ncbi:MAG: amidohydrolase family protein, partial [Anaerolineae bacterium]|nr:amidohydrolase family protein [Anaerolineae bacterium]
MFDLLITHARIIDGGGNPPYRADLGITGDRIAAIGALAHAGAARTIDAGGRVVCPGFIDAHAHSDLMLLIDPRHEVKIRQGVTTEIIGQDGFSYAPVSPASKPYWARYLTAIDGDPRQVPGGW